MFFRGSRYTQVEDAEYTLPDGRVVRYKRARFPPETEADEFHVVKHHERLDRIAWLRLRDPERYWKLCDANHAMWPDELLVPGTRLRIPGSED